MKKFKLPLLIFLLSFLPFLKILANPLIFHTHDGPVHWARMAAWYQAVKEDQIPPRWASELNYGYGNAVLNFIYPLPYFLSYPFLRVGLGLTTTFKIVSSLSFLLSGVFMFWAAKELLKEEIKALLVTLFYQFASFRFMEIIVRGAFGEIFTYAFVPLCLLGLAKISHDEKVKGFLLTAIATALLILSHNSISLSFFAALILFVFLFSQDRLKLLWSLFSLCVGSGLAAFYWLPAFWERKYTYGDLFMKDLYLEHFPTLKQLFVPNFLNLPWGWVGDVAVQIGFLPTLGFCLTIWFLLKRCFSKSEKSLVIFSLVVFFVCLLLMQPLSLPLWRKIALLRQFQFSWRLLSLVVLATSFTAISFNQLFKKNQRLVYLVAALLTILSFPYWQPTGFDEIDENYYWHYPLNTTYFGEVDTIWAAGMPDDYPSRPVEIISGKGEIRDFSEKTTLHQFQIQAKTEVNVLDHTFFFPGWRVFANNEEIPVQFQDPSYRGMITFALEPGDHQVEVRFTRTKVRIISEAISLVSLTSMVFLTVFFENIKERQLLKFVLNRFFKKR